MTSNPPAAQALEAAPVTTPATPATPAASVATEAAPGTRLTQAPDTSGLPTNIDDIEALFAGTAKVTVPNSMLETPPAAPEAAPEAPPAPEPAPVTPPPAEPTVTETAPEAPSAPEAAVPEKILPNRISTSKLDPMAQRALKLQHELNDGLAPGDAGFTSLRQAMDILDTNAPKPEATVPRPSPVEVSKVQVEAAKSKVTEAKDAHTALVTKRSELVEFGQDTADMDRQIAAANEAIALATVDARLAERDATNTERSVQNQAAEQDRQGRLKYEAQAKDQFPSVGDANSPLGKKVSQMAKAMADQDHPAHAVLFAQNASMVVSQMAAAELAQEMAESGKVSFADALASLMQKPTQAAPPPAADAPERKVLPATGGQPTPLPPPKPTGEQLLAQAGTDPDKLDALFESAPKGGFMLSF